MLGEQVSYFCINIEDEVWKIDIVYLRLISIFLLEFVCFGLVLKLEILQGYQIFIIFKN